MAGKKRRGKRRGSNPLQIRIIKMDLPFGVTPRQYITGLKKALRTQELPEGWDVEIGWRNPNTIKGRSKDWQEGPWQEVLQASRSGFSTVVGRVLDRAAAGLKEEPAAKKRSEAAKKGAATRKADKARAAKLAAAQKRSAAAKKGAATRKAKKAK